MAGTSVLLNGRDRALLRAIAAGRCEFRGGCEAVLLVDGLACTDFAAARRLIDAGLVTPPVVQVPLAPASLSPAGRSSLAA